MKKNSLSVSGIVALLAIGITIKIADTIGIVGILFIIGSCIGLFFFKEKYDTHKLLNQFPQDEFGPIFNDPRQASLFYRTLSQHKGSLAARLRDQQILRESLEVAIKSKNKATAESRMELAAKKYAEIKEKYRIPSAEWEKIESKYTQMLEQYATARYVNEAQAHLDRMAKVKTDKTKNKYAGLAKQALENGLQDPGADKDILRQMLREIPQTGTK